MNLAPGYDVDEHKSEKFNLCIYTIPTDYLKKNKLGPGWYREADAADDIDFHAIDCHIQQQGGSSFKRLFGIWANFLGHFCAVHVIFNHLGDFLGNF